MRDPRLGAGRASALALRVGLRLRRVEGAGRRPQAMTGRQVGRDDSKAAILSACVSVTSMLSRPSSSRTDMPSEEIVSFLERSVKAVAASVYPASSLIQH